MSARSLLAILLVIGSASAFAQSGSDAVPAAPEDGGPRNWQVKDVAGGLNLRAEPSTSSQLIGHFAAGTILSNLGCRKAGTGIWCDVQKFGGGPRGFVSARYLVPAISPDGSVARAPDTSASRAGEDKFDATGTIPCAVHSGQPMGRCEFGVARAGGGDATVVITKPDGMKRVIFFGRGIPLGTDSSQADPASFKSHATKKGDLNFIRVGDERYEIPDAVALGG